LRKAERNSPSGDRLGAFQNGSRAGKEGAVGTLSSHRALDTFSSDTRYIVFHTLVPARASRAPAHPLLKPSRRLSLAPASGRRDLHPHSRQSPAPAHRRSRAPDLHHLTAPLPTLCRFCFCGTLRWATLFHSAKLAFAAVRDQTNQFPIAGTAPRRTYRFFEETANTSSRETVASVPPPRSCDISQAVRKLQPLQETTS
jgi:hypothetical protein